MTRLGGSIIVSARFDVLRSTLQVPMGQVLMGVVGDFIPALCYGRTEGLRRDTTGSKDIVSERRPA